MCNIRSLKNTVIMSKSDIYRASIRFDSCQGPKADFSQLFLVRNRSISFTVYIYVYMNDECILGRTCGQENFGHLSARAQFSRRNFPARKSSPQKTSFTQAKPNIFKNLTPLFATNANMAHITSTY